MSSPAIVQNTGTTTLTTTAETVACTTPPLPVNAPGGQGVLIQGCVTGATGAGVTSVQVRIRQGVGTGGAVVGGVLQEAQAASSFYSMSFSVVDNTVGVPGAAVGTPQYTVTVQQVGATGNGTATLAEAGAETVNAQGA